MNVNLIWATPAGDTLIGYMARVSNQAATLADPTERLITYLIKHKHWSPFEMSSMCVEIETTRDVSRQVLRHRSFHFQEFSQRYAAVDQPNAATRPVRLQDKKNRQNSILTVDREINDQWSYWQDAAWSFCWAAYNTCLKLGIAKEVARALLPEGLSKTKMYMSGTVRDWLHYLSVRLGPETQLEHRQLAQELLKIFEITFPVVVAAARDAGLIVEPKLIKEGEKVEPINYGNA